MERKSLYRVTIAGGFYHWFKTRDEANAFTHWALLRGMAVDQGKQAEMAPRIAEPISVERAKSLWKAGA